MTNHFCNIKMGPDCWVVADVDLQIIDLMDTFDKQEAADVYVNEAEAFSVIKRICYLEPQLKIEEFEIVSALPSASTC